MQWETLVNWLFWIVIAILVLVLFVAIKNKNFDLLANFKGARNLGDLFK